MKRVAAVVMIALLLLPGIASAGSATDAALGLGAFAALGTILLGAAALSHPAVLASAPIVYAPPPAPVYVPAPPQVIYAPAPPQVVYYVPAPPPAVVYAPAPVYGYRYYPSYGYGHRYARYWNR